MKKSTLSIFAVMMACTLVLAGCNKTTNTPEEENLGMANPASVYCEENGGTLLLQDDSWLCMFDDGSYCEEWSYYRGECEAGEIMYNTVEEEINETVGVVAYTQEDLDAAEATIRNYFENEMTVKVENIEIAYQWDEESANQLSYCQELNPEVDECVFFKTNFFIPEQDAEMAWAFEPNKTITDYEWYLGRTNWWEWKVLTMGY